MKAERKAVRARGFSLVELMVVISIIGLLSTIVAINVLKSGGRAKTEKVRADLKVLEDAITLYHLHTNQFPGSLEELLQSSAEGWDGPYIKGGMKQLLDPWKKPYIYQFSGGGNPPFRLGSYGMDGAQGGDGEGRDVFNDSN